MKKNIFLPFLFLCSFLYGQQNIQIVDSETQQPIPYAKLILKGKDYYKNAEENGEITLKKDEEILEIQAFGYVNFKVEKHQPVYLLKPKFIEIDAVEIIKPKFEKKIKIGNLKTYGSFGGGINQTKPSFWGKVISFNNEKDEFLFIRKISFKTISSKHDAVIKLVIYENNKGLPGEILQSEDILCKAGYNKTQSFYPKQMRFPKEGIIVGFEWILSESNRYETTMQMAGSDIIKKVVCFSPLISGRKEDEENTIDGVFFDGKWHFESFRHPKMLKNSFNPAIELELTN